MNQVEKYWPEVAKAMCRGDLEAAQKWLRFIHHTTPQTDIKAALEPPCEPGLS